MPDLPLEHFRKNRSETLGIARGEIPDVTQRESIISIQIALSFFAFWIILFITNVIFISSVFAFLITTILILWFFLGAAPIEAYRRHKAGQNFKEAFWEVFPERNVWLEKILARYNILVHSKRQDKNKSPSFSIQRQNDPTGLSWWLGTSTGTLSKLWHRTGMADGQQVVLSTEDACQNIIVFGGISSGKTTCVMQPLLLQCLDQGCGGLIFDVKGDVKNAVRQLAEAMKTKLVILGPKHQKINLIEGLTPEVAASFLKSAFLLGDKGHLDAFWIDTASELCRNTLGLLSFVNGRYSLQGLYQYLFEPETRIKIDQELDTLLLTLSEEKRRLLKTYDSYQELIFSHFDAKVKSGVQATVAQALAPFNHPDLMDAFCSGGSEGANIQEVLEGTVYLVDMPLSLWGLGGKVAYTFIKLRFFNFMQNRHQNSVHNQTHPVFFMCDEFQEIVSANRDGLSDLNFWDKSRSSKTIGIIASQSVASFYAALGNRDLAHALLQNFRQKLCLRTEDPSTLEFMERLTGKARVKKIADTYGGNHSKTISESRDGVVDAQLFRELLPGQAVAILSIQGHSMDDVLSTVPVYV